MPRPRDPNKAYTERAKLRTVKEINNEIRRNYRLFTNGKITAAQLKSRDGSLATLRGGMSDPVEGGGGVYSTPAFNIVSVRAGDCVIPSSEDAPMRIVTAEEARQFYEEDPPDMPESDNVVDLHGLQAGNDKNGNNDAA